MDEVNKVSVNELYAKDEKAKLEAERKLVEFYSNSKVEDLIINVDENDPGKTKTFLLLIYGTDNDGEDFYHWEMCVGRQNAYDCVKAFIEIIDFDKSYIVAEDSIIEDKVRVIDFLKHVIESGKIEDPGFDPMDYIKGDLEEEDGNI